MDRSNLSELTRRAPSRAKAQLWLFMGFAPLDPLEGDEVPDPYYGGVEDFERVLDLCERAARGFLQRLGQGARNEKGPRIRIRGPSVPAGC